MALWDKLFNKKKDEHPGQLNPIVQKSPAPTAAPRVSAARPVPKPAPPPAPAPIKPAPVVQEKSEIRLPPPERETKSKKKAESNTKTRINPKDDKAFMKRGLARQAKGDHAGAIEDFSLAIQVNPDCGQAYASRGVSREAKGDSAGAKADYSKSIQIEIMSEINRQMRDNPEVEM